MRANKIFTCFRILAVVIAVVPGLALASPRYVVRRSTELPITAFNLTFRVGSADDPIGFEGLAELTAHLMREGGIRATRIVGQDEPARSRAELEEFFFPLAAEIGVSVEKEQISFHVTSTGDDAATVLRVLAQIVVAPAFDQGEFDRLKAEALDALTKQWPREDEEELGKAVLDARIYGANHPYSHVTTGTVAGLRAITLEKLKEFYRTKFTQRRLTVGLAGVVSPQVEKIAKEAFLVLNEGDTDRALIPPAPQSASLALTLVKGPFDAVGGHFGQPLPFNRASKDFPEMYLASWAFGKHRSFVGRLMRVVRELRGLNYGTYAYVQDFPGGGRLLSEPPQAARTRQAFTVWARPTPPENACFLIRQIYRELESLAAKGLTKEEFKLAQNHLIGNAPLLASGLERQLGFAIDSEFYGIQGDFPLMLQSQVKKATRAGVNALLRKYIEPSKMELVIVTSDPEKFKEQVLGERCGITYAPGIVKSGDVLAEDKVIATYPVPIKPQAITLIEAEHFFEK